VLRADRASRHWSVVALVASAPDYYDYREQADSLKALWAILSGAPKTTVTGSEMPGRVRFTFVSDDLFRTLGVAPAVGRFIAGLLYNVAPNDPATLGAVCGCLAVTTLLASLLPAWRASRTNPVLALRKE